MTTTVTIRLFSGRPNPRFDVDPKSERQLDARIRRLRRTTRQRVSDVQPFGVGTFRVTRREGQLRGFFLCGGGLIEFPALGISFHDTEGIEAWLIGICPEPRLPPQLKDNLFELLRLRSRLKSQHPTQQPQCAPNPSADALPFDPNWATTGAILVQETYNHQPCNNCYNYANWQMTDTYAQPGLGGGQLFGSHTPQSLIDAATRDGLVLVDNCTDPLPPGKGWYVALFLGKVGTEPDYHWLKQDKTGCWSHKLGDGSPRDTDGNLVRIFSPESAYLTFGVLQYPTFCGYFRTNAQVTIAGVEPTTGCFDWGWG